MFDFSKSVGNCAAVIDIGSGSVGVSIILSNQITDEIEVIWSHREYCLISDSDDEQPILRAIRTTLVNAILELGNAGLKALKSHPSGEKINFIQTTISAPWSYTVTRSINFGDEHPFEITNDLIKKLLATAEKQASDNFDESEVVRSLGLAITHKDIINFRVNGYSITEPVGQKARDITLSYLQAAISKSILDTLHDSLNKVLPNVDRSEHSFMYLYYVTLRNIQQNTPEMCLIDVTSEATEIGIVRNDILQHVTHTNMGTHSIARKIAEVCEIPKEEAYAYMRNDEDALTKNLSEQKIIRLKEVLAEYETTIANTLKNTGDALSIPRTIFLHTNAHTLDFFAKHLKSAATLASGASHFIHPFTSKLLSTEDQEDTALILSQHFYHYKDKYLHLMPKG